MKEPVSKFDEPEPGAVSEVWARQMFEDWNSVKQLVAILVSTLRLSSFLTRPPRLLACLPRPPCPLPLVEDDQLATQAVVAREEEVSVLEKLGSLLQDPLVFSPRVVARRGVALFMLFVIVLFFLDLLESGMGNGVLLLCLVLLVMMWSYGRIVLVCL